MRPLTTSERAEWAARLVTDGYSPDYADWCAGWANPAHPANQVRFAYLSMVGAA